MALSLYLWPLPPTGPMSPTFGLLPLLEIQDGVGLLRVLESVPLSDGPAGGGQHVGPVPEFGARCVHAETHASDGFGGANAIVVHHRHLQVNFL